MKNDLLNMSITQAVDLNIFVSICNFMTWIKANFNESQIHENTKHYKHNAKKNTKNNHTKNIQKMGRPLHNEQEH